MQLDDSPVRVFHKLKNNLIAQIELVQLDYNKKCTLITHTSYPAQDPIFLTQFINKLFINNS